MEPEGGLRTAAARLGSVRFGSVRLGWKQVRSGTVACGETDEDDGGGHVTGADLRVKVLVGPVVVRFLRPPLKAGMFSSCLLVKYLLSLWAEPDETQTGGPLESVQSKMAAAATCLQTDRWEQLRPKLH